MKKLALEDYPLLKPYFYNQTYALCTYSLPSMIVWSNHVFQTFYAMEKDSIIIAQHDSLLGSQDIGRGTQCTKCL